MGKEKEIKNGRVKKGMEEKTSLGWS